MEPTLILRTSTTLLAIAAVGGLIMAGIRFAGDRQPPASLAMLHGFLAAAAVTLLLYATATVGLPGLANGALALFVIAALGGVVLNLNYHQKQLPLPKWLVLLHAAAAVVGFLMLLTATWGDARRLSRRVGIGAIGGPAISDSERRMSELRYPNESSAYRQARDALLEQEQALVDQVKAVAARRRTLPLGGALKEDYVFRRASHGEIGSRVKFSELFEDKPTLLLYSFMFGPNWDKPCPSCTSLVDGFDRTWYQVSRNAAFAAIAKAPAERIDDWARQRGWSQIPLVSGFESTYQADYRCQGDSDDMQWPVMHVFRKHAGKIFHFWGTELSANHVDTVWPYWNLMDFTPEGRPDIPTPPQKFRSEFLEKNYLHKD